MKVARTVLRGGKLERAYLSQLGRGIKERVSMSLVILTFPNSGQSLKPNIPSRHIVKFC